MIIACDRPRSSHPQARLASPGTEPATEADINNYADSVNLLLPELEKRKSLVYDRGDYSFYITKYMTNGTPLLYIETGNSGEYGKTEKRYYLKNDRLLLYTEARESSNTENSITLKKKYFRNNIMFYSVAKAAKDKAELKNSQFTEVPGDKKNWAENIDTLENAINQRGEFKLVFEGITEYPKARYIILGRDELDAYRAAIRVEKEDDFIAALASDPATYKGARLELDWEISPDNEAVYKSGRITRN